MVSVPAACDQTPGVTLTAMRIDSIINDQALRRELLPVTAERIYLGHAGVAPISGPASAAVARFAHEAARDYQETTRWRQQVKATRAKAAELIGATPHEIALLGPTALGLNLVAHGLDWQAGDRVVFYRDDYPANVYAWRDLARRGVEPIAMTTEQLGVITWDDIEPHLTDRTRLVSLATCNFVSGYRIDHAAIGKRLHDRGILLCLDAIQTLGAFPLDVEHVDFIAADSHKWLLGPIGAGIFYVRRELQDELRPAVLGSWNVHSPGFIAQEEIAFELGARRYEPGTFNGPGIAGMGASLELLLGIGIDAIGKRLIELRHATLDRLRPLGFEPLIDLPEANATAIITLTHASRDLKDAFELLSAHGVSSSLRHLRDGLPVLRLSPHFYNTEDELDRVAGLLGA